MSPVVSVRARLRRTTVIAATGAVVAAGLLVPSAANATAVPQTRTNVLGGTSLATDGWTGPGTDSANGYDFAAVNGVLQASNYKQDGDRGVITQLESPPTAEAGEPYYTNATFDSYHIAFTIAGDAAGTDKYAAQPGLSLEMDADEGGNRGGGGLYFTVPSNHTLELDNFSSTDPYGQLWSGATKQDIAFTKPVAIDYTVKFVAGGADVVTVRANGVTVLSTGAGSYEGYSYAIAAATDATGDGTASDADKVDQVLFRSTRSALNPSWTSSNTDPNIAPWATLAAPAPTTAGTGFLFSKLTYGALNSSASPAFGFASTTATDAAQIANFEDTSDSATNNYDSWHIGSNSDSTDSNKYFDVLSNGDVQLNDYNATDSHGIQLLKGIPTADQPTDIYALVAQGLAWTLPTSNAASFQIALTGANVGGSGFTTLHSESGTETTGLNVVTLESPFVSTKSIGDIAAQQAEPLGVLLAALEPGVAANVNSGSDEPTDAISAANLHVVGMGVASEAISGQSATLVGPIYFGGVKYTFRAVSTITLGTPTVSGTDAVGNKLTASADVTPIDAALSYQWLRNGATISGAKSASYTLTSSDFTKKISVKVTASASGDTKVTQTSAQTSAIGIGTITAAGTVGISGDAKVGVKLSLTKPTYDTTPTLSYQWYRGASKISGATSTTYTVAPADLGSALTVTVTAKKTDYTTLPLSSDPTSAVAPGVLAVSAAPTLKGTFKSGKTITASSTGWTANGVATTKETKRYYWFVSDGTAAPDFSDLVQVGTGSTLKLAYWAQNLKVSVYVVGVEQGYTTVTSSLSLFSSNVQ